MSADLGALAHRALVAATLHGLLSRGRPRVTTVGEGPADLAVAIDDPPLDASALERLRDAVPDGVVAVVVASTSAAGLVRAGLAPAPGDGAFARAAAWSVAAARGPLAPAVSAARLREIAALASAAGLVLVEPEVHGVAHRSAVERAIFSTIAHGATARPLLFARRGPRSGLARVRPERVLDGFVAGRGVAVPPPTSLAGAALSILAGKERPVAVKELLREARDGWARPASADDGPALARGLVAAWIDGGIDLYAVDPETRLDA